jgi:hypothetical protein
MELKKGMSYNQLLEAEMTEELAKREELDKSNYGKMRDTDGTKVNQYSEAANAARKANRTGYVAEGAGPNSAIKEASKGGRGSAKDQAAREAKKYAKMNRNQPVKTYSPEEKAAYIARLAAQNSGTSLGSTQAAPATSTQNWGVTPGSSYNKDKKAA